MMSFAKAGALFASTALAELAGCYFVFLWLRAGKSGWLVVPAVTCLALFAWLLTLHPQAAGRVYAAYGCVYVALAIAWLWLVDGVRPTVWDVGGATLAIGGMAIIMLQPAR